MWHSYYLGVIFTLCLFCHVCPNCVFQNGKYDLSSLDWEPSWSVVGPKKNGSATRYEISLCKPFNYNSSDGKGCFKSSICQISNKDAISYGNAIENATDVAIADNYGNGFSLFFITKNNCSSDSLYRSSINFVCGPNLGAPELMFQSDCQVSFYWRTSAACSAKSNREVPCYVIDEDGLKYDLSPLIRSSGYRVLSSNPANEVLINVCSDLNSPDKNCPTNSSACLVTGPNAFSLGSPMSRLRKTGEGLLLTYETDENTTVPRCGKKPKTVIFFRCPSRGNSQPPKLIFRLQFSVICQYHILWETEYACPENLLKASLKTCQFTHESHGVEIDLSPLKKQIYDVKSNDTDFKLSICGGLGNTTCDQKNWKSVSVCMTNSSDSSEIVGTMNGASLKYADRKIVLTYPTMTTCSEYEHESSVINFACNRSVGDGSPMHVFSSQCTHFFNWQTRHACPRHFMDLPCYVIHENKKIDLHLLSLSGGYPWRALDSRNVDGKNEVEYFLNVCGHMHNFKGNVNKCDHEASACLVKTDGTYLNLGMFTKPPSYDAVSQSVTLEYTNGSQCRESMAWKSSITFFCKPGHIKARPILSKIDESECKYEFEWHTAEACPEGEIIGNDCKIHDPNLGISYDLNILRSQVYHVKDTYNYYISICEPLSESPCTKNTNSTNVGVCQEEISDSLKVWNIGQANKNLSYNHGIINLTYVSGDPYNDVNKTARMTIILFICDYHGGNGSPVFVEEEGFAYVFLWHTSLVCPHSISTECVAYDPNTHLVYDLSSLALSGQNWVTSVEEHGKENIFYLNVCRSLDQQSYCNSNAAACAVEMDGNDQKKLIPNLGQVTGPPEVDGGFLTLTYSNGDPCVTFGRNSTYTTIIHFLCADGEMRESGPRILSKVGNCIYTFLWTTKAACPTGEVAVKNSCQLTDPVTGFTFDLTSLTMPKQPYTVTSNGRSFQLNICDKVVQGCASADGKSPIGNISVCEMDSNGALISVLGLSESYTLSYFNGKDLTLIYSNTSRASPKMKSEVIITFPCNSSIHDPKPKFLGEKDGQLYFEMESRLSCIETHFDCIFSDDNGNMYDLTSLAKYSNNWELTDSRYEYSNMKYHINFCRPLNKVMNYKCPGGSSSACATDDKYPHAIGHNLGTQKMTPKASEVGSVTLRYTDGSFCDNGMFRYSTTIHMYCFHLEELVFVGMTPECEYIFSFSTPAACPLQSNRGNNCLVTDPVFGYTFDLNPLKSKNTNYNVPVGDYVYVFNVCDKLNGFTNNCKDSSACQMKPKDSNFSFSLGLPNDNLVYKDGVISLEYTSGNGNCHGIYNRTTKITFTCDHGHEDRDGPMFIIEAEDCAYLFEWPTIHACPPFDVMECSAEDDKGNFYDLSKLSLLNDNYYVKNPGSEAATFVINVCRSVVHTPDSICPYLSASCMVDEANPGKPIDLGHVNREPYIEDGRIKIVYSSGDPCNETETERAHFMQSVIQFICDESKMESAPEYVGKDGCTYYFDWLTIYACPQKTVITNNDCTVEDPLTGYVFNFTSLKHSAPYKVQNRHHQYSLSICGADQNNSCNVNAGMCQEELIGEKRNFSGGMYNSKLLYNNGIIYLNYSGGDLCHQNHFQRNTIIHFVCGVGLGEPVFVSESEDCTYFFSWKTELACESLIHCAVKNGSDLYELTPLTKAYYYTAASSVAGDDASYYINPCNSLPQVREISCPPGTAICRVSTIPEAGATVAESLGRAEYPPFLDFEGHVTVIYTNGSICDQKTMQHNRARIIFLCEADAGLGEPVLIDIDKEFCLYVFEWRTSIVCPEKPDILTSLESCEYVDHNKGIYFNLKPLQKQNKYYTLNETGKNALFIFNICGTVNEAKLSNCAKDSAMCLQEENVMHSYGLATTQKFLFDGIRLRLVMTDGDDCPSGVNGKRSSEIFFMCDPTAGLGAAEFYKKYTCMIVFMWRTSLVCQNMQYKCMFDINGGHYDFNLLSSLSHNWNTTDPKNNTYWFNLCRGMQSNSDDVMCLNTNAVCMRNSTGAYMSLGLVQTMEVKATNTSDLILNFEAGDRNACSSVKSEIPLSPITRVFMRCGANLGNPKFMTGPDTSCFYDFVWETSLACAEREEEVLLEKNGTLYDKRFQFSMDINDILNKTFKVHGMSKDDRYIFLINLGGVYEKGTVTSPCNEAAICQTKPENNFQRDIGSTSTKKFYIRGSELHMSLKSLGQPCGKNKSKNVTTYINLQCSSSAGIGNPVFLYESGDCDYLFAWDTIVVCPNYHRRGHGTDGVHVDHYQDVQYSRTKTDVAIVFTVILVCAIIVAFILLSPTRRSAVMSRFRSAFSRVKMPYFRYKRHGGERLILVDASHINNDVELLT